MKKFPEKFDIIVANPPYSKFLHLKFLMKAYDLATEDVLFVHPSSSYIDTKGKLKLYKTVNDKIEKNLKSISLFNGNPIFNIGLFKPCSVTHIDKSYEEPGFILDNKLTGISEMVPSINRVTIFGNRKEFWSIYEKVMNYKND